MVCRYCNNQDTFHEIPSPETPHNVAIHCGKCKKFIAWKPKEVINVISERIVQSRISRRILDDVCLDCYDFLNHKCVECDDCPVHRLKKACKYEQTDGVGGEGE